MQRGRKSAAHLSVVPVDANAPRPLLTPCRPLNKSEKHIFNAACVHYPHLGEGDTPLLTVYSIVSARMLTKLSVADLEKLVRTSTAVARALRITARSRVDPKTLSRSMARPVNNKYPWADDDEC
jgi:hypothetical protein